MCLCTWRKRKVVDTEVNIVSFYNVSSRIIINVLFYSSRVMP